VPPPTTRRLRGYSFDPSLAIQLDTAMVAEVTFDLPWEPGLKPGPVGEYVEVVDCDPATGCFYAPVDLNDPGALAQDGLTPSVGNPQFHQQMAYASVMLTVANFERALGRKVFWSPRPLAEAEQSLPYLERYKKEYVGRLRIYPHAMRQANAYYSPSKKALLFGYFPAAREAGGMVFTCLSHDIVAHETTHALLDGMYERFMEPTHPDSRAFHEAFADLVALFQRFGIEGVVRDQIARTRGEIAHAANMLGALAQQFGQAVGSYGALRDAIGRINPDTKQWEPLVPNPDDYRTVVEEHARGAILVAAVFDAFLSIYRRRVADLQRIATGGTGILPEGAIHPDLVNRFASEAARTARQFLAICVRALDYCPPVDITFGDYLRALITADYDTVPDDDQGYRVALIEAFRRRGILPEGLRVISEDSLLWDDGRIILELDRRASPDQPLANMLGKIGSFLRQKLDGISYARDRWELYVETQKLSGLLHGFFTEKLAGVNPSTICDLAGLEVGHGSPPFQVHKLRVARRVGPDGDLRSRIIVSLAQRRFLRFKDLKPATDAEAADPNAAFLFRGGSTLIFDLDRLELSYTVKKPLDDRARMDRQRRYLRGEFGLPDRAAYFGGRIGGEAEPLALLHLPM
jgi:hypothetical protein